MKTYLGDLSDNVVTIENTTGGRRLLGWGWPCKEGNGQWSSIERHKGFKDNS